MHFLKHLSLLKKEKIVILIYHRLYFVHHSWKVLGILSRLTINKTNGFPYRDMQRGVSYMLGQSIKLRAMKTR